MFNSFHKKEKPIQGMMGMGGGATGNLVGGGSSFQLTGGSKSVIGDYTFHKFTTGMPGSFTVDTGSTNQAVILIAAGGGGGGCQVGGGGGGGGLIHRTSVTLTVGSYNYSVGAGGIGRGYPSPVQRGDQGGNSTLTFPGAHPYGNVTNTAIGGGGAAAYGSNAAGTPGGSGGGGGGAPTGATPGIQPQQTNTGWSQYGNPGGSGRASQWYGGGGGGANGAGEASPTGRGGNGGSGKNFPEFPTAFGDGGYFCGGGGGCRDQFNGTVGTGGAGGGGNGGGDEGVSPMLIMHGDPETGGGGGGRRDHPDGAGDGGTGVIIIRYPNSV